MPVELNIITGIILAGGRGSRMGGTDKCLLTLKQKRLIDHVIDRLAPQTGRIIISANRNLSDYEQSGHTVVTDSLVDFQGPLAGIHSALQQTQTPYAVVIPCDCPLLDSDFVAQLYATLESVNARVAVARNQGKPEPLFVLMKTSIKDDLHRALQQGVRKAGEWIQQCDPVYTDISKTDMFMNLNTPEELEALEHTI